MEILVKSLIEQIEFFCNDSDKDEYCEELKKGMSSELLKNPNPSNQALWLYIKCAAEFMEEYVG